MTLANDYGRELIFSPATGRDFARDMRRGKVYSFARYSDGDWQAILELDGQKKKLASDPVFGPATAAYRAALRSRPAYRLANCAAADNWQLRGCRKQINREHIIHWCKRNGLHRVVWYSNTLWMDQQRLDAEAGRRWGMLDAMRGVGHVVVIGHPRLAGLDKILPVDKFIATRTAEDFSELARAEDEVLLHWHHTHRQYRTVYAFSCMYIAKLVIHNLYDTVGRDSWMLDFGSVLSPYVGRAERRYQGILSTSDHWPLLT